MTYYVNSRDNKRWATLYAIFLLHIYLYRRRNKNDVHYGGWFKIIDKLKKRKERNREPNILCGPLSLSGEHWYSFELFKATYIWSSKAYKLEAPFQNNDRDTTYNSIYI